MNNKTVEIIKDALIEKKAQDVVYIDVKGKTSIADGFLIANGRSVTQVKALLEQVEEQCEKNGITIRAKEGYDTSRWIIVDVDGIMVHIFHFEDREFYDIERLWIDGDNVVRY